ncbi:MAG: bifunctional 5,10-methylene-tetrahydrofolate dehydrogenase/5,10-methylene-tetrahydrofolate cyclohydrolase, partial [Calditrichaeota bacterium]
MTATILDGKAVAGRIREEVAAEVSRLQAQGQAPGLAVILVGEDPASRVYVRNKARACEQVGIHSLTRHLP